MGVSSCFDVPICLFLFKRSEMVYRIIDILKKIQAQKVYVFSDGPREEQDEKKEVLNVRNIVDTCIDWNCEVIKDYSGTNLGCSANINRGFNKVLTENPYAIFLEDDVLPKEEFFYFCKELLLKYKDNKKVQFIGGFNGIGDNDIIEESYCFSKYGPMSGAIALWSDRWFSRVRVIEWANRSYRKLVKEATINKEFRKRCYNEYSIAYKNKVCEWDVLFQYDLIIKQKFSIVPRKNLVSNCGYGEYGFHAQNKGEAERFKKYMTASEKIEIYPLVHPTYLYWNISYEKVRQKAMLEISGNWLIRHINTVYLGIKNVIYKYLPYSVWKTLKKILFYWG